MYHRLKEFLERGSLPEASATPVKLLCVPGSTNTYLLSYGTSVPSAASGYAVGGLFIHTDGTTATRIYQNVGSVTSCTFSALVNLADAQTLAGAITFSGGILASGSNANDFSGGTGTFKTSSGTNTISGDISVAANKNLSVASGTGAFDFSGGSGLFKTSGGACTLSGDTTVASTKTLAVTTADKLTVNSVIVPQVLELPFSLGICAATEYDLWVAPAAYQVTAIKVVPSTLEGGAMTATIVKVTGTATPVKTTTPMVTADAINLNTGAYTVQTPALTGTAADLQLAAGDRIGIDFSGAVTAAKFAVGITLKRI